MTNSIAVFGLHGALGKPVLDALTSDPFKSKVKLPIHAFTSKKKPANSTNVEYFDARNASEIEKGLQNVDILVDVRNAGAPDLGPAAKKAGIKAYILSEYGVDYEKTPYSDYTVFRTKADDKERLEKQGINTVSLITSMFADWTFDEPKGLNVSIADKANYANDQKKKISVTFISDVAKSIASLATKAPGDLKSVVRISGDTVTPGEVADAYEKASGQILKNSPLTRAEWDDLANDVIDGTPTPTGFLDLLGAVAANTDEGAFFEEPDNDYVNPHLFEWTPYLPIAQEVWA